MKRARPDLVVGVFAVVLALGCAWTARRGGPSDDPDRPEITSVARGERVFLTQCRSCHPSGEAVMAPGGSDKALPAFLIRLQVRRGLGTMPAFPRQSLAEADLDDLVAYLMALRRLRSVQ